MSEPTPIDLPVGLRWVKLVCRLGRLVTDSAADADAHPDLLPVGGTLTLAASPSRVRIQEADGRWRSVEVAGRTYTIRADGELVDGEGRVGVWIPDPASLLVEPQGYAVTAVVKPTGGTDWRVTFGGGTVLPDVVDLVAISSVGSVSPSVTASFDARLYALETGGGVDVVQAIEDYLTANPPSGGSGGYPVQHIALTSEYTLTPTGWPAETVVTVVFTQDSTGAHTVEFDGNALNVNAEPHAKTVAQFFPLGDGAYLVSYPGTTFHLNADGTFTITGPAVVEPAGPAVEEPTVPTIIAADTFTRADDPTTLGVTEVGSKTWVAENSTWGIKSNAARMYSGSAIRGHVNIDAGTPDMRVTATRKGDWVTATYPTLVARYSSEGSYYGFSPYSNAGETQQKLTRRNGSSSVTLVDISETEVPDGAVMSLSAQEEGNGTRLICTLDGIEVANYLDQVSNRPTGTKCGFFSYSPSTMSWDDFTVEGL